MAITLHRVVTITDECHLNRDLGRVGRLAKQVSEWGIYYAERHDAGEDHRFPDAVARAGRSSSKT